MTHRQFKAWEAWFELEWNVPNRADYYAMNVAAEVRRSRAKNPGVVKVEDLRLKLEKKKVDEGGATQEQLNEMHKQRAIKRLGRKPTVVVRDASTDD